jgi:hypothetical protein
MTWDETSAPSVHPAHDASVVAAVSRLSAEFAADLQQPLVRQVVLGSRRDLAGSPVTALPELVERLARQRLLQSMSSRTR